ncbi:hypothetical protein [Rhodococcus sp. JVH1]|uniref:hypothetical protein n=1 Tax=Rhodococcus sp. JVH1 TaxID=745408 RepID=UPI000272029F|nr:hypothetical protein [Rhodococcus sp. JVH1]EJJ00202.1 hypothetical protein JVH1_2219 [Rhodococcus sp. JVH1]
MSENDRRSDAQRRAEASIVNKYNMKYMGFEIDGPVFKVRGKEYPINMITAEVITGAQTSTSRTTITRVVGGGLVAGVGGALLGGAAKKSTDTSKIYISVVTPDGEVVTKSLPTANEKQVRFFADRLQSAATRKWPLVTAFGSLPLHPSSRRDGSSDTSVTAPPMFIAVLSVILGIFVHVAFFLGLLLAFVVWMALVMVESGKDAKALDETDPGWREREAETRKQAEEDMWRTARDEG